MKMPKDRRAELEANPDDRRHGTRTGVNLGCHCDACCEARLEVNRERREKLKSTKKSTWKTKEDNRAELILNPDDPRHGKKKYAHLGCPCPRCKEAAKKLEADKVENLRKEVERRIREEEAVAAKIERIKATRPSREPRKNPKDCCTVDGLMLPMMGKPSIDDEECRCSWCGRPGATNRHHIVRRGAGKLVVNGREVKKPTVLLCGNGNTGGCHGKAHSMKLHFRWVDNERKRVTDPITLSYVGSGHWEALETDEPTKYQEALERDGWRRL